MWPRWIHRIFQVQPIESSLITVEGQRWSTEPVIPIRDYSRSHGQPVCARGAGAPAGRASGYDAVALCPDAAEDVDEEAPECAPDALRMRPDVHPAEPLLPT